MGLGLLVLLKKLTTKESPCLAQDHPQPFGSGQADLDISCPGHMTSLQPVAALQNSNLWEMSSRLHSAVSCFLSNCLADGFFLYIHPAYSSSQPTSTSTKTDWSQSSLPISPFRHAERSPYSKLIGICPLFFLDLLPSQSVLEAKAGTPSSLSSSGALLWLRDKLEQPWAGVPVRYAPL